MGEPGVDGLSVEQRKRLTIAVELVANPSIVFMDEPTSGLDARAAAIVMRTVRNIVRPPAACGCWGPAAPCCNWAMHPCCTISAAGWPVRVLLTCWRGVQVNTQRTIGERCPACAAEPHCSLSHASPGSLQLSQLVHCGDVPPAPPTPPPTGADSVNLCRSVHHPPAGASLTASLRLAPWALPASGQD